MPRKEKQYHFIYKTTNLLNSKFYIGMHSTNDLGDGYVGSGKLLWRSIKKHGLENHQFEIIEFLDSRDSLKERESEVVNEELLANPLCMNLKFGGDGGWDHLKNDPKMKIVRSNNGKEFGTLNGANKLKSFSFSERSNISKRAWRLNRESMLNNLINITGKAAQSDEAKAKRKESLKKIKFQQGENNSQYGTCWICNEVEAKKIKKEELQSWLDQGWRKGRK